MQFLRFLLFPFSVLYDVVTRCRNWAFDKGFLTSKEYNLPVIAVGNLSTGGTGKTPMIEYLIHQHKGKKVAVLSRGYGRSTKGFIEVTTHHEAYMVGDEPLQIKSKHPKIVVAVCESRVDGIDRLLQLHDLDIILLDDAFQHRYVKASHYVLLTSYTQLFYKDYLLPSGNLRESRSGYKRAHDIVVTKCPMDVSEKDKNLIIEKIGPLAHQRVFFSYIDYDHKVYSDTSSVALSQLNAADITLVTGIANPVPFKNYLSDYISFTHLEYKDHYNFKESDIRVFKEKEMILTTEKDYVRLKNKGIDNLYYLPIKIGFLGESL